MSGTKARNLALAAAAVDSAGNITADLIDNIDSTQFLRKDTSDTINGVFDINTTPTYSEYHRYYNNGVLKHREAFATINDSISSGGRIFIGDGGQDIIVGTSNGSLTPSNSFIALNHSGEISLGAGSGNKHVVIDTSGNVGINTTEQRVKLAIKSSSTSTPVELINLHNPSTVNGSGTQLTFSGFNAESAFPTWRYAGISGLYDTTSSGLNAGGWGGKLNFFVNRGNSATAFENVMTITGGGNVGIGTNTPSAKLHVMQNMSTENTQSGIKVQGYSPSIELMDKDSVQNWYIGIDDNSSNRFEIARGYGPGQGITPAITIDSADVVGFYGPKMRFPTGASDPVTGLAGEAYYNTADKVLRVHNGIDWSFAGQGFTPMVFDPFGDGSSEALWKLDGNGADDGGAYNGVVYGSPTWSTGAGTKSGQCMDLSSNNTLSTAKRMQISGLGFKKNMALSFWMYYYGSTFNDHGFFGFNSGQGSNGFLFHFHAGSNEFYIYHNSGGGYFSNTTVSNPQSWNHFCLTYDNNQTLRLYLNGNEVGNGAQAYLTATSFNGQEIAVGRDMCCEDDMRYTNGAFDQVRWFNRALDAGEVSKLYGEIN